MMKRAPTTATAIAYLITLCAIILCPAKSHAHWQEGHHPLVTDLVSNEVNVTINFQGGEINLYGVKSANADIAIVLRGPGRRVELKEKGKTLLGWRFIKTHQIHDVSSFYALAANKPIETILPEDVREMHHLGWQRIRVHGGKNENFLEKDNVKALKQILSENLARLNLRQKEQVRVQNIGETMFKAQFKLPHNVETGNYVFEIYHIQDQEIIDLSWNSFDVQQTGFSADIKKIAVENSILYAMCCIALAIFAGFVSNRLKRII